MQIRPRRDLKRFVTKLQAQNAAEVLGEAGKTLSDKDRQLVAEVVRRFAGSSRWISRCI